MSGDEKPSLPGRKRRQMPAGYARGVGNVLRFDWYISTLVFRFCQQCRMAVSRIFLSSASYGFSGFVKEGTPYSRAKTVIPRDHLYRFLLFLLEEWMTSLIRLEAVILTAAKQTMKSSRYHLVCSQPVFSLRVTRTSV